MLHWMNLKWRLLGLVILAIFNVCAVGLVANSYLNKVLTTYKHITSINVPAIKSINLARNAQRDIVILVGNLVASEHPAKDIAKIKSDFQNAVTSYGKATEEYERFQPSVEEAALRQKVSKAWLDFTQVCQKIVDIGGSSLPSDLEMRQRLGSGDLVKARKEFRESFQSLVDYHEAEAVKWSELAATSAAQANQILLIATLAGLLLVSLVGFYFATDLTRRLSEITGRIANAASSATQTTEQISTASERLTTSSTQQATSLQQTAASMEEISAMVQKNAESAQRAQSISEQSKQRAIDGRSVVLRLVQAIDSISDSNTQVGKQVESSNEELKQIINVISDIEAKTQVINEIVFQTKLLSFNASVEAARAGEHGKGFAVVAEEMGSLAQMSGSAAQSISGIVTDGTKRVQEIIQKSSGEIGQLLNETGGRLKDGIDVARQCQEVLESLVDNVTTVNGMAHDIAIASSEQAHGVKEVNLAMNQLDSVVQQTSTASANLTTVSQSLVEQTGVLDFVVTELTTVVQGKNGSSKRAA